MRFFFDTCDNDRLIGDEDGLVLGSLAEARRTAIKSLPAMASDALPDGETHRFAVELRGEGGERLLRATLTFRSDWLLPGGSPT